MSDSSHQDNKTDHRTDSAARLPVGILLIAGLAAVALFLFAGGVVYKILDASKDEGAKLAARDSTPPVETPLSILPPAPDGVTVIEKQAENAAIDASLPVAPVAQGADLARGYAMDLGGAMSFLDLSRRFSAITEANGPENFQRLEPRAVLKETMAGLEARLLIGPFETETAAREACEVLILDEPIDCRPTLFEGELIARQ